MTQTTRRIVPINEAGNPADERPPASQTPELDRLLQMQHIISTATPAALALLEPLNAALARADAIQQLRAALDENVMRRFYPLMNSPLGFRCDRPSKRNPDPYTIEQVRECFIQALLLGLRLTDNEWNIISERVYVTREGFSRLLRDFEGLTDLRIDFGVPTGDRTKGVLVPCKCSWMVGGVCDRLEATIPIKGDEYATLDQLLGKCDRKIKCRIYNRLTGSAFTPEGEIDDAPASVEPAAPTPTKAALDALPDPAAPKPEGARPPDANNGGHQPQEAGNGGAEQDQRATDDAPKTLSKGDANAQPPAGWTQGTPEAKPEPKGGNGSQPAPTQQEPSTAKPEPRKPRGPAKPAAGLYPNSPRV